jgi:type VI secretion system ImpA family protein
MEPFLKRIEEFLQPVSEANPAGPDLRYEDDYFELEEAREGEGEDDSSTSGVWKRERRAPDWNKIIVQGQTLLIQKSKDLQIAAWVTEALLHIHGLAGLKAGLDLIRELQGRFWETAHPGEGDLELRQGVYEFLDAERILPLRVRSLPVTRVEGTPELSYSYLKYRESRESEILLRRLSKDDDADEILAGKLRAAEFDKAADSTDPRFYLDLILDLDDCQTALGRLIDDIRKRWTKKQLPPTLTNLPRALREVEQLAWQLLERKRIPWAGPEEQIEREGARNSEILPEIQAREGAEDSTAACDTDSERGVTAASRPRPGRNLTPEDDADARKGASTVTRYTDIVCPRRVWIGTPRIAVVVRLTVQLPVTSAAVSRLEIDPEQLVRVALEAPGFDHLGPPVREVKVSPEADSEPVVFDLKPRQPGATRLTLDFFQGSNPLGTTTVPVEITTYEVPDTPEPAPARKIRTEADLRPPDFVLLIAGPGNPPALTFTLIRGGGTWWRSFTPVQISGQPETAAADLYATISKLVDRNDPVLSQRLAKLRAIPKEDVERRIRQLGQNLWRNLIPEELRLLYARERSLWKDKSLLVLSDEPHFPWELLWPYDENGSWKDEAPWCITMRMTRWLRRDARGNGNETPPGLLKLRELAVLAPLYQLLKELPGAQLEREFLIRLAAQHRLRDASPKPEYSAVLDLLEKGGYDWIHAAAHGNFHPETPDGESALWLENDRSLTPDAIVGSEIEGFMRQRRPAFVFNACQTGRQDFALTRIGGWANRLLSAGAGLFLGPQWEVQDSSAFKFAEALYTGLFEGKTVSDAVREARQSARSIGDPTWLAYSVFAHPNAVVESSAEA